MSKAQAADPGLERARRLLCEPGRGKEVASRLRRRNRVLRRRLPATGSFPLEFAVDIAFRLAPLAGKSF